MVCGAYRTSRLALRIHLGLRHQSDLRRGRDPTGRWTDVVHRLDGEELRAWLASCQRYHRLGVRIRGQGCAAGAPVTSMVTMPAPSSVSVVSAVPPPAAPQSEQLTRRQRRQRRHTAARAAARELSEATTEPRAASRATVRRRERRRRAAARAAAGGQSAEGDSSRSRRRHRS